MAYPRVHASGMLSLANDRMVNEPRVSSLHDAMTMQAQILIQSYDVERLAVNVDSQGAL
jgi:hypothetical protein